MKGKALMSWCTLRFLQLAFHYNFAALVANICLTRCCTIRSIGALNNVGQYQSNRKSQRPPTWDAKIPGALTNSVETSWPNLYPTHNFIQHRMLNIQTCWHTIMECLDNASQPNFGGTMLDLKLQTFTQWKYCISCIIALRLQYALQTKIPVIC